ncbi:phosphate ABC transporter ATP-binding protein PstB [Phormidesmis priestleyi]
MVSQNQTDRKKTKAQDNQQSEAVLRTEDLKVFYGDKIALKDVSMEIPKNQITALIGPSGCGKSTLLRCFNRLNDLIEDCRVEGKAFYRDKELYASKVDPVEVRRRIGMVFQKPNPFPKSIYENIAYGARINGHKDKLDELVEKSLQQSALWDEVKDKLKESGLSLSGGQQQRLCLARAISLEPEVILMDEPTSSLDPISSQKVEELLQQLKEKYTIVIVTHSMQQARRASDFTAFFNAEAAEKGNRFGYLVEHKETKAIFDDPQEDATKSYVSGNFG